MSPDESVFRAHLAGGAFLLGASSNRWRLVDVAWPYAVFRIFALDGIEYGFRFQCQNYPQTAPTAQPWDINKARPLRPANWPSGKHRIPKAFNPGWKGGAALYLPCDRLAIEGHVNWHHEHPSLIWNPDVGIVHYLRVVHELLNSGDYRGRRAA